MIMQWIQLTYVFDNRTWHVLIYVGSGGFLLQLESLAFPAPNAYLVTGN